MGNIGTPVRTRGMDAGVFRFRRCYNQRGQCADERIKAMITLKVAAKETREITTAQGEVNSAV